MTDSTTHDTATGYLVRLAQHREQLAAQEASYVCAAHRVGFSVERIAELAETTVERVQGILATDGRIHG